MSWTSLIFPFLSGQVGPGQPQTVTNVPADGTPFTVVFTSPFATSCAAIIWGGIRAYSGTDQGVALSPREVNGSRTANGFQLVVEGGQQGSTCSVDFLPFGS